MQRTVSHSLHADASNIKCKKLESEGKRPTTVCKKLKQQKTAPPLNSVCG